MPRKKKTAVDPDTPPPTIEEQLEAATIPDEPQSVAQRLRGIGQLVAAAREAGIDVPLALQQQVPTVDEVIAEYRRQAKAATESKNDQEFLRDHLLAHVDQAYLDDPAGDFETLPGEGFALERKAGFHESVSKTLLVQLGVDPDIIDRATVVTPYYYWMVKESKAAKAGA